MNHFISFDVETANKKKDSLCQIGFVEFEDGKEMQSWATYVDPETEFDPMCSQINKITSYTVRGAPKIPVILEAISKAFSGQCIVHHTAFDRQVIESCCKRFNVEPIHCHWVDSANVVRQVWPKYQTQEYGLAALARDFNIKFKHHDAQEDARVAGLVVQAALNESKIPIETWAKKANIPARVMKYSPPVAQKGNPDGRLKGEVIVFTGELSISREEAAQIAAQAGCEVGNGVTKHTTIVVVGNQDLNLLAGHEKSTKHRKAEELISKGQNIRIMSEDDFKAVFEGW